MGDFATEGTDLLYARLYKFAETFLSLSARVDGFQVYEKCFGFNFQRGIHSEGMEISMRKGWSSKRWTEAGLR